MHNAAINAYIRSTIRAAGSKLVAVEAVTKDGEIKRFVFSDAARPTHMASIVTVSGAQAVESRKRNNPDLFNVWDINERRWRSFNLNNVLTIKTAGARHVVRYFHPGRFYRPKARKEVTKGNCIAAR